MRFPEFEGNENSSYREYSFKDIFLFSTGKNIKQNEASPAFETPCVRYGELYHMYNEVIIEVVNKTNLNKSELLFSQGDEILLPSAGEDPLDIGSASALTIENVAIGRTINILRPMMVNVYSHIYVSYYINQKLRRKISTIAKGVSISNVYNSDLRTLEIVLPTLPEQKKISDFLIMIDERIQTQNKIIEQLETLIKGLCQKLILSQIPERKLEDCVSCYSSSITEADIKDKNGGYTEDSVYPNGTYPVYGATGVISLISKYQVNENSILIVKDGSGVGKVHFTEGKFSVIGTLNYLLAKPEINLKYIFYCLKFFDFKKYKVGSSIPHIYFKDYRKSFIYCPSFDEQQQIERLLSTIDERIYIENILLKKYKMQKQCLLQNLFI